jgi:hypothetical protein
MAGWSTFPAKKGDHPAGPPGGPSYPPRGRRLRHRRSSDHRAADTVDGGVLITGARALRTASTVCRVGSLSTMTSLPHFRSYGSVSPPR